MSRRLIVTVMTGLLVGGCSPLHRQAFLGGAVQGVRGDPLPAAAPQSTNATLVDHEALRVVVAEIVHQLDARSAPENAGSWDTPRAALAEVLDALTRGRPPGAASTTDSDAVLMERLGWAAGTVLAALTAYMGVARPLRQLLVKPEPRARLPPDPAPRATLERDGLAPSVRGVPTTGGG